MTTEQMPAKLIPFRDKANELELTWSYSDSLGFIVHHPTDPYKYQVWIFYTATTNGSGRVSAMVYQPRKNKRVTRKISLRDARMLINEFGHAKSDSDRRMDR